MNNKFIVLLDRIPFMKTLILIISINTFCFTQNDSTLKIDAEIIRCFIQPDSLPQLIGGLDSLQSRLQYPEEAIKNRIEGSVFIQVNIDSSGIPLNPRILKGLSYGCDEEAIRLILTSEYLPAVNRGKKVKSQIVINIKFKLPER